MARGSFGAGLSKVHIPGASVSVPHRPSVAMPAKPYNPTNNKNVGHTAPRIKPIKTNLYSKAKGPGGEDPSLFQGAGFFTPGLKDV